MCMLGFFWLIVGRPSAILAHSCYQRRFGAVSAVPPPSRCPSLCCTPSLFYFSTCTHLNDEAPLIVIMRDQKAVAAKEEQNNATPYISGPMYG